MIYRYAKYAHLNFQSASAYIEKLAPCLNFWRVGKAKLRVRLCRSWWVFKMFVFS